MYGINLVEVAKILSVAISSNVLFGKNSAAHLIYQEIIKYAAQKDIEMTKVMMRALAQQSERAYEDITKILREHFTEQELQEIL